MRKELIINIFVYIVILIIAILTSIFSYKYYVEKNETKETTFTTTEMPTMDGSKVVHDLLDAYYESFTNQESTDEYTDTLESYERLMNNEVDLIIVRELTDDEKTSLNIADSQITKTPVINDALVFMTGVDNTVSSLSSTQLQSIYTGATVNWQVVGGTKITIQAYQQPENSWTQSLMTSFIMKDLTYMTAPTTSFEKYNTGTLTTIAPFEPTSTALGYSTYYTAKTLYDDDEVKYLSISGKSADYTSIRNGDYPYTFQYYIVTRSSDTSTVLQSVVDEMTSERGQLIARNSGYIPVK